MDMLFDEKCPLCGADLPKNLQEGKIKCGYCDTTLKIQIIDGALKIERSTADIAQDQGYEPMQAFIPEEAETLEPAQAIEEEKVEDAAPTSVAVQQEPEIAAPNETPAEILEPFTKATSKPKFPTWAIVGIIAVVLFTLLCCIGLAVVLPVEIIRNLFSI